MAVELVGGSIVEKEHTAVQPIITCSYTIGSTDANTALIVLVHNAKKAQVIISIKWNTNEDLTLVGEKEVSAYHRVSIYRLLNPTATTANIVVTFDAEPNYGACLIAFLLTGVDSTTPTSDNQSNNGTAASSSVAIPNCTADDMAIAVGGDENNVASYAITTGTEIWKGISGNWDDTGSARNTGTGNVTIAFSHANKEYCIIGCRIRAAAGGATLVVQDAGHAHSADNVALTQAHTLAVAEALHGHVADSPVLTQAQLLSVQRALHGHSADNIALVQAHILAVQDSWHAHRADNIVWITDGERVYPIRLPKRYAERYPPRN